MTRSRTLVALLGLAIPLCCFPAEPRAASITYYVTNPVSAFLSGFGPSGGTGETEFLLYPAFDPSLGTLTGVVYGMNAEYEVELRLSALGYLPEPPAFELDGAARYSVSGSIFEYLVFDVDLTATPCTATNYGSYWECVAIIDTGIVSYSDSESASVLSPGPPPIFDVVLQHGVQLNYTARNLGAGFASLNVFGEVRWSPTLSVTYTYSPIPEPSVAALIAVGFLLLGAVRQRRAHV